MLRRTLILAALVVVAAGCTDHGGVPTTAPGAPAAAATATPLAARERLAQHLAEAMRDPAFRAAIKKRFDASNAPEGKLQFQALARADGQYVMSALAQAGATSVADLLADLDQARGLELYLPVAAQRAAWTGDDQFLVATIGQDGEAPVAFSPDGTRQFLDPRTPPAIPVLALVPQETDFTHGHPENMLACVDMCGGQSENGGASDAVTPAQTTVPGLYLIQSHFNSTYESWLKGNPEFEYHVYGIGDDGASTQIACTGEHQPGVYNYDQNGLDWTGAVMLLSDADYATYQARHPNSPIRIVAWEDDNEACVDHADSNTVSDFIDAVDGAYRSITSGKVTPWYTRGIEAAPSIFKLITAAWDLIKTNDDLIGNAVETSIAGPAPGGANWLLKSDGTTTTGWFTTEHRP